MSIRRPRLAFEDHYTQVPNAWARDERISRKARGLLLELMSHRPGWDVTIESLVEGGPEGRDAIRTTIQELERFGYLVRRRERNDDGTLAGVDYEIADPWSDEPTSDYPTQANPVLKKTITQEDHLQEPPLPPAEELTTIVNSVFESLWVTWPKPAAKGQALAAWVALCYGSAMTEEQMTEVAARIAALGTAHRKHTEYRYIPTLVTVIREKRWMGMAPGPQVTPPGGTGLHIPAGHRPVFKDGYVVGSEPIDDDDDDLSPREGRIR